MEMKKNKDKTRIQLKAMSCHASLQSVNREIWVEVKYGYCLYQVSSLSAPARILGQRGAG